MATEKSEIAAEMLDWSIKTFLTGSGYYAAINLAGAAEEVLGIYLRNGYDMKPEDERFTELFLACSEPNNLKEANTDRKFISDRMHKPKNSIKHMYDFKNDLVSFDAEEVAIEVIKRAISNYHLLAKVHPIRDIPSVMEFQIWEWERYKNNTTKSN